jgi:hypothetical protein
MKRILFVLMMISFFGISLVAQDAEKSLKAANKALNTYNLDPAGAGDKLLEAKSKIDEAMGYPENKGVFMMWVTRGQIYNSLAEKDFLLRSINKAAKAQHPTAGTEALDAFTKGMALAVKKYETKDCLDGLTETMNHLNNAAISYYDAQDYANAYRNFKGALEVHDILIANNLKSVFTTPEAIGNQYFVATFCATKGNILKEAEPFIEKMYQLKYDSALVYEALFVLNEDKDDAKALKYLEEGRKKYPDETSLLFSEINYYLKKNQMESLIEKLKAGIAKEPDNISLYVTLANVYDNLAGKKADAGEKAISEEYAVNARTYYEKTLELDPKNFEALYGLGAASYNKAAKLTKELQALSSDFSKEGERKFKAKEAEVKAAFGEALPFFQRAESLNANDLLTLGALKEIYARLDNLELSGEFKKRYENVEAGKTNQPYFNK